MSTGHLVITAITRHAKRMEGDLLEPWMLRTDWRADTRPYLIVDLANWPLDVGIDPLPPVPLIGIGALKHPASAAVDVIVDVDIPLKHAIAGITRNPQASAALVQLLRTTSTMPIETALTAESFAYAMLQGASEHAAWKAVQARVSNLPMGAIRIFRDGATLDIQLDRPAARNAIDRGMRDALFDAFMVAALDPSIERVLLHGADRCFSVGAELGEFGTTIDPAQAHAIRMRTSPSRALILRQDLYEAHVDGACVGSGLELAAFARRITARDRAWFQLPEIAMGILPGAGGCVSIPRRIGRQRAALLMLSGKRIGARTALRWGLIDAIVDDPPGD